MEYLKFFVFVFMKENQKKATLEERRKDHIARESGKYIVQPVFIEEIAFWSSFWARYFNIYLANIVL